MQFSCNLSAKTLDFIAESFGIRANDRMLNLVLAELYKDRRNSGETYGPYALIWSLGF